MIVEFDVDVFCSSCGAELVVAFTKGRPSAIEVDICPNCLNEAKKEAKEEAKEEIE